MEYRSWSELSLETRDRMRRAVERCERTCKCVHVWDAECAEEELLRDDDQSSRNGSTPASRRAL